MLKDKITPFLEHLRTRNITNKAVSILIDCTPEHVSRLLKAAGVTKVPGKVKTEREAHKKLVKARYEYRETVAKTQTLQQAMRTLHLSERTIRRWKKK